MATPKQTHASRGTNSARLFKFGVAIWSVVGVIAVVAPWAYALSAVLFAAFLHLAALDGAD